MAKKEELKVAILLALDEKKSISNINKAISRIEKSSALKKLNIRLNVDKALAGSIDNLNTALARTSKSILDITRLNGQLGSSAEKTSGSVIEKMAMWADAMTVLAVPFRVLQSGFQNIRDLDTAMVGLKKITNETADTYQKFLVNARNTADGIGVLTTDVIKSTTEWTKLGYSFRQAQQLAGQALVLQNVGDMSSAEEASRVLFSTIKGFGVEVDNQGKNVQRVVDVFNEVGNHLAISSAGIGEAMKQSASALHEGGNTMEEAVALIAAANSQIQDPASVGEGLRTVALRLRGISEEGEDLSGLIPALEAHFNQFGLTLKTDENKLKSTYEIFKDLSGVWGNLTDLQQSETLGLVAGSGQANVIASLLQNFDNAQGALASGLNSMGSAARENEKYLDSIEAKVNQFKNAVGDFWNASVGSDSVKALVDMATMGVETLKWLTDHIGTTNLVILALTTSFLKFSSAGQTFAKTASGLIPGFGLLGGKVDLLNKNIRVMNTALTMFPNTARAAGVSLNALRLSLIAARISAAALQATITLGLSVAITLIVQGIVSLVGHFNHAKQSQKEYFDNLQENISKSQENISTLEELNKKYREHIGTQEELTAIKQQMSDIMPNVIDHYDSEGNAVYKTAEQIDALIEKEKELNLARRRTLADTMSNRLEDTASEIQSNSKVVNKKRNDFDYNSAKVSALEYAQSFISKNNLDTLDKNSNEYVQKMEFLQSEIKRIFSEKGQYVSDTFLVNELLSNKGIVGAVEAARSELGKLNGTIQNATDKVAAGKNKFAEEFKSYNSLILDESKNTDKNARIFLDHFSSSFVDASSINKDNADEIVNQYKGFADEINAYIIDNKIDITTMIESGDKQGLLGIFTNLGVDINIAADAVDKFTGSLQSNQKQVAESFSMVDLFKQKNGELLAAITGPKDELKKLNQLIYDVSHGQSLNAEAVADLIFQYPQLAGYIKKTADGWTIEKTELKKLREEKLKKVKDDLENEKASTRATLQNSLARLQSYGIEIKAINNLNDAKNALKEINKKQAEVNAPKEPLLKTGLKVIDPVFDKMAAAHKGALNQSEQEIKQFIKLYEDYEAQVEAIQELISDPDFGNTKPGSKSAEVKDQLDATQAVINAINKQAKEQSELNKIMSERAKDFESQEQYQKAITETTNLLASQRKAIELLESANNSLEEERSGLQHSSGRNMTGWLDGQGEQSQEYINLYNSLSGNGQKILKEQFDKWKLFTQGIDANKQSIAGLNEELSQTEKSLSDTKLKYTTTYLDNQARKLEKIDYSMSVAEKTQAMYAEGTKEYNDQQNAQNKLLQDKINFLRSEVAWTEQRLAQGELTGEQINELNEYLKKNKLALLDAQKAQQDYYENWSKSVKSTAKEAMDTVEDYYEKQGKEAQKALDKSLDDYKDYINERKKLLHRGDEQEDFEASLGKLKEEKLGISKKIDVLSLDSSIEAQYKREQLEQELADKVEEISKLELDRKRDLRDQDYDDLLDKKEKDIQAAKDTVELAWQANLAADKYYSALKEAYLQENVDNMQNILLEFSENAQSYMDGIGRSIDRNLIEKMQDAQKFQSVSDSINKIEENPMKEVNRVQSIIDQMRANSQQWAQLTDSKERQKLADENRKLGDSIDAHRDEATGIWYDKYGNLLYHHKGGEAGIPGTSTRKWWDKLLKSNEVPAILKKGEVILDRPLNFIWDTVSRTVNGITQFASNASSAKGRAQTAFHFDKLIHVDKIENKADADYLLNELDRKFKQNGFVL